MWRHLKDNSGIHPIWPALIIGLVCVLIVFIGFILLFSDSPILEGFITEWKTFVAWLQRIFKPTPYNPI